MIILHSILNTFFFRNVGLWWRFGCSMVVNISRVLAQKLKVVTNVFTTNDNVLCLIILVWPSKSKTGPPYVFFLVRNKGKYVGVKLYIPFKNTGQVKKKLSPLHWKSWNNSVTQNQNSNDYTVHLSYIFILLISM